MTVPRNQYIKLSSTFLGGGF